MILKRKEKTAIVLTKEGVTHPDIIATITSVKQDKKNKVLEIDCGFYHSLEAFEAGFQPMSIGVFGFQFSESSGKPADKDSADNILRLGYPTYSELMQSIAIDENGDLVKIADDVEFWILNQTYVLDIEGKPFGENWEFAD